MLNLPVSIGEALDKLTILDIKMEKLPKERREFAKHEYDILYDLSKEYIENNEILYEMLKKINLIIWDEMDMLRDNYNKLSEEEYFKLCKLCIDDNDKRFRIKNKINNLYNSKIKEQKSYKKNNVLLYLNNDNFDENYKNYVKKISIMYDEINICLLENNKYFDIKEYFKYDTDIKIINIDEHTDIEALKKNYNKILYNIS